ncbi:MAG: hypothetical protein WBC73_23065 [Phormidesmis sp.]
MRYVLAHQRHKIGLRLAGSQQALPGGRDEVSELLGQGAAFTLRGEGRR